MSDIRELLQWRAMAASLLAAWLVGSRPPHGAAPGSGFFDQQCAASSRTGGRDVAPTWILSILNASSRRHTCRAAVLHPFQGGKWPFGPGAIRYLLSYIRFVAIGYTNSGRTV
ncbi:MAG: hypothetical protein ACOH2S_09385 [Janthinobacterium svalbardensis]